MEELNQGYSLIENRRLDILELSTILLILASFGVYKAFFSNKGLADPWDDHED